MPQASNRSWSATSTGVGADRPRREGVGGGGMSVRISGLGRTSAATPIGGRHLSRCGGAHVVPVGQELLTAAAVLDADDAGFGELAHRPVDGVDRAAQTPGQGLPGRHPGAGAIPVAKQQGVEAKRAVGDGRVDHHSGTIANRGSSTTRVPAAGGAVCVGGASRVTVMAFRADALRVGKADSTAALDGGARQECVRKCTGTARTQRCQASRPARWSGMKPQVRACSGRFRHKADAGQTAYGSEGWGFESLRARSVETDDPGS